MSGVVHRLADLSRERRDLVEQVLRKEGRDPSLLPIRPRASGLLDVPLAYAQESLWFMCQLASSNGVYNLPTALRLLGSIRRDALERAALEIARRHEGLRTRFPVVAGRPVQEILPDAGVTLSISSCVLLPAEERLAHAMRHAAEEAARPFDLAERSPWRMRLYELGPDDHLLLLVFHHLIWDGWSSGVWLREMVALYQAFAADLPSPLPEPPLQYADYAVHQRKSLSGTRLASLVAFWQRRLEGIKPLALPTDRPRPDLPTFAGGAEPAALPAPLSAALEALCRGAGVTPYMALLAAFQALLSRYARQERVVVGTPVANRQRRELEGVVGPVANIVVMATDLGGDPTFAELLARVREVAGGAYAHQDIPFEMLVDKLRVARDARMNPVFQVMFALHTERLGALQLPGLRIDTIELDAERSHFDLGLHLWRLPEGFSGCVSYNRDLFDAATIRRMIGHYQVLLEAAVADPGRRVSSLPLLTPEELRWLAERGRAAAAPEEPPSVEALFETRAAAAPSAMAVDDHSYGALRDRAGRIAGQLRRLGARRVAIFVDQGTDEAAAILGALGAGVPFVPLDPAGSAGRHMAVLVDVRPDHVLTRRRLAAALPDRGAAPCFLDDPLPEAPGGEGPAAGPGDPAYFSYAAGHRVTVSRRTLARRIARLGEHCSLEPGERLLATAAPGRDFFPVELLFPLTRGAAVLLARSGPGSIDGRLTATAPIRGAHVTPASLAAWLALTPEEIVARLDGLRWVLCSGGHLLPELAEAFQRRAPGRLVYLYSPPEVADDLMICSARLAAGRAVLPAGRPEEIAVHVLERRLQPAPIGVPGVIHVGPTEGAGSPGPGALIRTADRGLWLADGALRLLGHEPDTFWHDGIRFRLGEVEAALLEHPAIDAAHVIVRAHAGREQLVSYVVPSGAVTREQVDAHLARLLPDAGACTSIVLVNALPVTPEGHVDARALAALPVLDAGLAAAWEARLSTFAGADEVKVIARARQEPQALVHVTDLLPDQRAARPAERHTTAAAGELPDGAAPAEPLAFADGGPLRIPEGAPATLTEALMRTAEVHADRGLTLVQGDREAAFVSYRELLHRARCMLAGLRARGLRPGDRAILQVEDLGDQYAAFWACVLGGITPVTVATSPAYDRKSGVLGKLVNVWELLGRPTLLASRRLVAPLAGVPSLYRAEGAPGGAFCVAAVEDLAASPPAVDLHPARASDVVFLQLSSGSTGLPKCIQETHEAILDHIHGVQQHNGYGLDDIDLSWLPVDHVVPILTCHLKDTTLGIQQIHVRPEVILADPLALLSVIEKYRVTHTFAPNFAFKLINDALAGSPERRWDLSSLRRVINAGEQVVVPVAQEFLRRTADFGLRPGVMQPAFGMAEVCTGITYANDWTPEAGVIRVRRASLRGVLEEAPEGDADAISFVDLGPVRPGLAVRIVGPEGRGVPERVIGLVQVRGRAVTPGYLLNDAANRESFSEDGWFNTGDLGFLRGGRLIITGRQKEMIIVRGANLYCYELEDAVSAVEGVEPTFVATCAVDDPSTGTDGLAVFFVSRRPGIDLDLLRAVRERVSAEFGVSPAYVIPLDKEAFPRTTSGKIQRAQLKRDLIAGRFDDLLRRIDLALGNEHAVPDWFHRPVWEPREIAVGAPAPAERAALVLLDAAGLGQALAARLGEEAVLVEPGPSFVRLGARHYAVNPIGAEDHDALLAALAEEGIRIGLVLHLATYGDPGAEPDQVEALLSAHAEASGGLLTLAQAWARSPHAARPLRLLIAASHTSAGAAGQRVAYERASLRALAGVIAQEWPAIGCRHVELAGDDAEADAERLLAEARVATKDREVRYREGKRFVLRLERALPVGREEPPWRRGDLVLLSGGLGGVGVEVARSLVEQHDLRLLLVGRTPLAGGAGAARPADALAAERSAEERGQAFQELARSGRVIYEAVDVTDLAAMQDAVGRAERRFGVKLAGAIHLAGVFPTRLLVEETPESLAEVARPKLAGAFSLAQILGDGGFLVGFGSAYGIFGGVAVGAYAAASCAVDAFLAEERRRGRPRRQAFAFTHWEELGMSRGYALADRSLAQGYSMIGRRRGLCSLIAGLRSGEPHLVVGLDGRQPNVRRRLRAPLAAVEDLVAYVARPGGAGVPAAEGAETAPIADRFGTPAPCGLVEVPHLPRTPEGWIDLDSLAGLGCARQASAERVLPRTGLERTIAAIWREVLQVDAVDVDTSFFALGGQSVLLVQVLSRLKAALEREISVVDLFRYPTVSSLAAFLEDAAAGAPPRRSFHKAAERAQRQREAALQRKASRGPAGGRERR
ncbi:condensation domain-containing protein [Sorangium sp. So ce1151]|uniref:condensation domain-containing protein n=1 Tax=Sorangium sp. So ce1151 TaxID=3133332 RepID=UPI003F60E92D